VNQLNKYLFVAKTSARSNLAYFGDVIGRVIFLGVILYVFLRLWQVTFAETGAGRLGGLTLAEMLWYLTITESISLSAPRIAQAVDSDVREGLIAVQLVRPMNYPLYCLSRTMGERAVRFLMNLCVGIVLASIFVGPLKMSVATAAVFMFALPLAFVLDFLGSFLIGLSAFWLEDTTGLYLLYSRMTMILGGMLIPIELFPDQWQRVVRSLPFSAMVYGPAHLFVSPSWSGLGELLLRQIIAVAVFATIVAFVYHKAQRRIFANGG